MNLIGEGNYGRPPSIGWWPTGKHTLRWWNGEVWSWLCVDTDKEVNINYYSSKVDPVQHGIKWYPRPQEWPDRSKT
jgi:hypothetical protein